MNILKEVEKFIDEMINFNQEELNQLSKQSNPCWDWVRTYEERIASYENVKNKIKELKESEDK